MSMFGLNAHSGREVWSSAFGTMAQNLQSLNAQISAMQNVDQQSQVRIHDLEVKLAAGAAGGREDKTKSALIEWKSFGTLERFSGDEKAFADWEFELQTFVRPLLQFEAYLDWVKECNEEITVEVWTTMKSNVDLAHGEGKIKMDWYDDLLCGIVSLLCTDSALASVKNVREEYGVRGTKAFWKITREVASKSGVRLERLADIVHYPKQITDYKMGKQMLERWEAKRKELEKIGGQPLSDLTKRTTPKKMLPPDLLRDLERDRTLKSWQDAWNFVLEQIPLMRDWSKKQFGHAMDLDAVEQQPDAGSTEDDWPALCGPCEGQDQRLDTLKGGGKGGPGAAGASGKFDGNGSYCYIYIYIKTQTAANTPPIFRALGKAARDFLGYATKAVRNSKGSAKRLIFKRFGRLADKRRKVEGIQGRLAGQERCR